MGAFQRKRGGGGGNEKTPISQIGLEGGGPQKFKLQKCIKWRIVRLKARWWSDCAFLPPPAEPAPAAVELLDISLPGTAPGPAGPAAPRPAPVPPPAPVPVAAGLQAGEGGGGASLPWAAGPRPGAAAAPAVPAGSRWRGGGEAAMGNGREHRAAKQANGPLPRHPPATSRDGRDPQKALLAGLGTGALSTVPPRHRPGCCDGCANEPPPPGGYRLRWQQAQPGMPRIRSRRWRAREGGMNERSSD